MIFLLFRSIIKALLKERKGIIMANEETLDINLVWRDATELLKPEMVEVTYSTWIEPLEPIELKANEFILKTPLAMSKNVIEKNYIDKISNALFKACGFPVKAVILTETEAEAYEKNKPKVFVPQDDTDFGLVPEFTFDTFVVGSSNRMAHAAAVAVADMPGSYNPLYIYGHSGLGKTHLMHAIGNYALGRNPSTKVLYVTSEDFTNDLINAIKTNTTQKFRDKYRLIDILLIDDIQFIAGKVQTEEEFFHTFNHLYNAGKQIIISGDRPPNEMLALEERLRTRFQGDLMCDIQPPDYETRMAILKKKCNAGGFELEQSTLEFIAENVVNNIRELNGALTRVRAFTTFNGSEGNFTNKELEEILKDIITPVIKSYTIEQIAEKVSDYYDITKEDMQSPKQNKEVVLARQVAMYISRQLTSKSLKEVGKYFNRDYTTVINSLSKMESQMHINAQLKHSVDTLIHSLKES